MSCFLYRFATLAKQYTSSAKKNNHHTVTYIYMSWCHITKTTWQNWLVRVGKGLRPGYNSPLIYLGWIGEKLDWNKMNVFLRLEEETSIISAMLMILLWKCNDLEVLVIKVKEHCKEMGLWLNVKENKLMATDITYRLRIDNKDTEVVDGYYLTFYDWLAMAKESAVKKYSTNHHLVW